MLSNCGRNTDITSCNTTQMKLVPVTAPICQCQPARGSLLGAGKSRKHREMRMPTRACPLTSWQRCCSRASVCEAYQCNGLSSPAGGAAAGSPAAGRCVACEAA